MDFSNWLTNSTGMYVTNGATPSSFLTRAESDTKLRKNLSSELKRNDVVFKLAYLMRMNILHCYQIMSILRNDVQHLGFPSF